MTSGESHIENNAEVVHDESIKNRTFRSIGSLAVLSGGTAAVVDVIAHIGEQGFIGEVGATGLVVLTAGALMNALTIEKEEVQ